MSLSFIFCLLFISFIIYSLLKNYNNIKNGDGMLLYASYFEKLDPILEPILKLSIFKNTPPDETPPDEILPAESLPIGSLSSGSPP
jgi:hypothetical protein